MHNAQMTFTRDTCLAFYVDFVITKSHIVSICEEGVSSLKLPENHNFKEEDDYYNFWYDEMENDRLENINFH